MINMHCTFVFLCVYEDLKREGQEIYLLIKLRGKRLGAAKCCSWGKRLQINSNILRAVLEIGFQLQGEGSSHWFCVKTQN